MRYDFIIVLVVILGFAALMGLLIKSTRESVGNIRNISKHLDGVNRKSKQ